jgi:hypothetical protein
LPKTNKKGYEIDWVYWQLVPLGDYTYLRICGATATPHLLPKYVPNRLVLGEIAYQTVLQGFNASLLKEARKNLIPYNFSLGHYYLKDPRHARQEASYS